VGPGPAHCCWKQQWAAAARFSARCREAAGNPRRAPAVLACVAEQRQGQSAPGSPAAAGTCCCAPPGGTTAGAPRLRLGQGNAASCSHRGTTAPWNADAGNRCKVVSLVDQLLAALASPWSLGDCGRSPAGDYRSHNPGLLVPGGRLRRGWRDWTGLDQLERANLRWIAPPAEAASPGSVSLHPVRYRNGAFSQAPGGRDRSRFFCVAVASRNPLSHVSFAAAVYVRQAGRRRPAAA